MKAQLIGRYIDQNNSVSLQDYNSNHFLKIWHYHPELELDIILSSTGTRFVGDNVEHFVKGDIVLLGKNLPHLWLNDNKYFEDNSELKAKAIVIHINDKFLRGLMEIPEMATVNALLLRSKLGISFRGKLNNYVIQKAQEMIDASDSKRVNLLIDILIDLASRKDSNTLSSSGFVDSFNFSSKDRMAPVYEFVMNNFKENIRLDKAAALAHMNTSSFSRYFSQIHKKTFTQFLNEMRIGYACKLLIENKYNVSQVCFQSGFNNLSNFNRVFKQVKHISPTKYVNLYSIE